MFRTPTCAHGARLVLLLSAMLFALAGCQRAGSSTHASVDAGVGATRTLTTPVNNPSGQSIVAYDSGGWSNSGVIVATAQPLLTATGLNKGVSTLYIMFFDATSVPTNGTAPSIMPVALAAGQSFTLNEEDTSRAGLSGTSATGLPSTNGWCWAASTTPATLTVDATSSVWLQATYAQ